MNRGSLLIVTLWIVTILAALSVAVARYLSTEVRLTRYRLARFEARELARSGVALAQQLIQQDPDPQVDWSGDLWAAPQAPSPAPGRGLTVTITDEERKLNISTATAEQLTRLLGDGGLAQAVVDYTDPPAPEQEDRPTDDPPYYAKNTGVSVLEELTDVPNMDADHFETLSFSTTPFTAATVPGGPLNLNTALPEVLAAAGLGPATIQTIVQYRDGPEHFTEAGVGVVTLLTAQGVSLGAEESTLLAGPLFAVGSQTFRVSSEGTVESPNIHVRIQAVLQRSTDSSVPKIIAWSER